jgi:predicted nucleic acid-binding protein
LETSVLIDYMSGEAAVEPFFDTVLPSLDEDVVIPQPALFEVYVGHFRDLAEQRGESVTNEIVQQGIENIAEAFSWARVVSFDTDHSVYAGQARAQSLVDGPKVDPLDAMIAGVALANDAVLATADSDYDRVPDLETMNPREVDDE